MKDLPKKGQSRWMLDGPEDGYLMHFADGPMAERTNVETIASKVTGAPTLGNTVVDKKVWPWPLPDRLKVLSHEGVGNVAMWPEEDTKGLPEAITDSPNAVTYVKVRESQLPDDSLDHVMRGAEYRLDRP